MIHVKIASYWLFCGLLVLSCPGGGRAEETAGDNALNLVKNGRNRGQIVWKYSRPANVYFTKTEVTVRQYLDCVEVGECTISSDKKRVNEENWKKRKAAGNVPVTHVSFREASEFCRWKGGALPTARQFYNEATNNGKRRYPWGNKPTNYRRAVLDTYCWRTILDFGKEQCEDEKKEGIKGVAAVCTKPAGNSISGLCDMCGNVREWVRTGYAGTFHTVMQSWITGWIGQKKFTMTPCLLGGSFITVDCSFNTVQSIGNGELVTGSLARDNPQGGFDSGFRCVKFE